MVEERVWPARSRRRSVRDWWVGDQRAPVDFSEARAPVEPHGSLVMLEDDETEPGQAQYARLLFGCPAIHSVCIGPRTGLWHPFVAKGSSQIPGADAPLR